MKRLAGIAASLCLALVYPVAPAFCGLSCPDVDAAQAMLLKAASAKNDQDLQQMPRKVAPPRQQPGAAGQPAQPALPGRTGSQKQPSKAQPGAKPSAGQQVQPGQLPQQERAQQQDEEVPPNVETAPVPEDLKHAALLVKQADDACQAGNGAEASEKAKAAMALMKR